VHDSASAEDLAALCAAVLRSHDQLVRMEPKPRSLRVARRLNRLHLSWLLIPWFLVVAGRLFLPAFRGGFPAGEQQAARLYRRLSGKDPHVARAEVSRIGMQRGVLDERLRDLDQERPGAPRGADPVELDAAAGALIGYYLAGRRTDDELLAQVDAAWSRTRRSPSSSSSAPWTGSALAAAGPTRRSRSGCRWRPTATAWLGGAGLTGRPGRARRPARATADARSWSRERHPGSVTPVS
jgi:hypothetical protein